MPTPLPANEACRLAALHELQILDTPPEERFDRITRLARRLLDVPTVLVSLVDADRQWFKSRIGLDATETPRSVSFCAHAVAENSTLVVADATEDPRFRENPLVVGEPRIRFYAGCVLRAQGGYPVGTLCVIDGKPRHPSREDMEVLRDLADTVEQQLTHAQTAMVDPLTGLANRRGLTVVGDYMAGLAKRSKTPLTVLVFDLDGFKTINDLHGHATGDRALMEFAAALHQSFRESDVVARLGGDEFCTLLVGTRFDEAHAPLARLRQTLAQGSEDRPFEIAFSVGTLAFDPARHESIAQVLDSADKKMYSDKRAKREPAAKV